MRTRYTQPSILLGAGRVYVYREACFAFRGSVAPWVVSPCVQLLRFIHSFTGMPLLRQAELAVMQGLGDGLQNWTKAMPKEEYEALRCESA